MRKRKIVYIFLFTLLASFIYYAHAKEMPKWFLFNKDNALKEWQEKIFKGKVLYSVESEKQDGHLSAISEKSCSGLFYRIKFNSKKLPLISWQWKVVKFPEKAPLGLGDVNKKQGWIEKDDYAARVYVIFPSFNFRKTKSIEYIWDKELPEGKILTSPYSKNIKLIIVESGMDNIDKWVFEKRNIYEDYKASFGSPPRSNVGAIALMTDTDNTLSTAEALYKNMKVGYRDEAE